MKLSKLMLMFIALTCVHGPGFEPGRVLAGPLKVHVAASTLPEEIPVMINLARTLPLPAGSLGEGTVLEGTPGLSASRSGDFVLLLPSNAGALALTSWLHPAAALFSPPPKWIPSSFPMPECRFSPAGFPVVIATRASFFVITPGFHENAAYIYEYNKTSSLRIFQFLKLK